MNGQTRRMKVPPLPGRGLEAMALLLTAAGVAALVPVPGIPPGWLAFAGLALVPGFWLGQLITPPGYRRMWNVAAILFILANLIIQLALAVPAQTVLVLICLFLLLHRWYTPRGRKEHVEIWCLTALLMLVSGLQPASPWSLAALLVWGFLTMPFLAALAARSMVQGRQHLAGNWGGVERFAPARAWPLVPLVAVMALAVFLVTPRTRTLEPTARGLSLPSPAARSMLHVGFSGSIHLQGMTMLRETDGIALQLRLPPGYQGASRLRFRVHPLDAFDGEAWHRSEPLHVAPLQPGQAIATWQGEGAPPEGATHPGARDLIGVRLVNFPGPALPIPEATPAFQSAPRGATLALAGDGTVLATGIRGAAEYRVLVDRTSLRRPRGPLHRGPVREEHLEVPPALTEAVRALSMRVPVPEEAGGATPFRIAEEVETYFRRNGSYSLDLTHLPEEEGVLEEFMAGPLRGHCELFASAMAMVLRDRGIPARLAAGFSGTEPRMGPGGETVHVVKHRHAHAWVEAYDPEAGWVPFDPTPAPLYAAAPSWAGPAEIAWLLGRPFRQAIHWLEGYDARAQAGMILTAARHGHQVLATWEHGALLRAEKRFRQNIREAPVWGFALFLLMLNVLAWMVRRRWLLRGRATASVTRQPSGPARDATGHVPELFRRLLRELSPGAPRQPEAGDSPGQAIMEAAGRGGLDRELARELARLYTEWRFGHQTTEIERRIEALLRELHARRMA